MRTRDARQERTLDPEDIRRIAMLAAALRIIGIVNQLQLHEQRLTVTGPGHPPLGLDFAGHVPFGFAFTAGHEADFQVPCGYRFLIEHVSVSGASQPNTLGVQMVTRSAHIFRQMTLPYMPEATTSEQQSQMGTAQPILVHGSTSNTLLFCNGAEHGSSTVPPDTFVQMWGHLEPTDDPLSS